MGIGSCAQPEYATRQTKRSGYNPTSYGIKTSDS